MDQSFGVPDAAANMDLLRQQVDSNAANLHQVFTALGQGLVDSLQANDTNLAKIQNKIFRSLRGRINGNNYHLQDILRPLQNTLNNLVQQHGGLLNQAMPPFETVPSATIATPSGSPVAAASTGGTVFNPAASAMAALGVTSPDASAGQQQGIGASAAMAALGAGVYPPVDPHVAYVYHGPNGACASNLPPNSSQWHGLPYTFVAGPMSWQAAAIQYGNGTSISVCATGGAPALHPPVQPQPAPTPGARPQEQPQPDQPGQPSASQQCPTPQAQQEECQFYCVDFGSGDKQNLQCLYSNTQSIQQAGFTIKSGPHKDQTDCLQACKLQTDQCQPPEQQQQPQEQQPAPAPTLTQQPVTPAPCALSADGKLPAVGSPEWCGCLDDVTNWAVSVSKWLNDVLTTGDASNITQYLPSFPILSLPILGEWLDLGSVLKTVLNDGASAVSTLWQSIVGPVLTLGAQVTTLIGLDLLRAIIKFLSHVRLGWDLVIWGTLDLHIILPWLEKIIDLVQHDVWHIEPPSGHDAMECYLQTTADEGMVRCWMGMASMDLDAWMPVIDARREKLKTEEIIEWGRRNDITDENIAGLIQRQGWFRFNEAVARIQLYDELPTIQDHLHWLQRNVFDEEYVTEFQLDEGFDTRFWPAFGHDLRAKGYTEYRAKKDYEAHWINPAPEQLKEMVYRLNPEFTDPSISFSLAQYQRVLQEQDVGAFFRPRFAAIAYRVPALGYIRDMYRADVFGETQLATYHQQLGYSKDDSANFVYVDQIVKTRYRASASAGWTPAAASKANAVGLIPDATHSDIYAQLGWTEDEAAQARGRARADLQHGVFMRARSRVLTTIISNTSAAQAAGILSVDAAAKQLTASGWPQDFALSVAQSNAVKSQVQQIQKAITRIRSAFHAGEVTSDWVLMQLPALGVQPAAAQNYVAIWTLENTPNRKRRTATQITTDLSMGRLTLPDALARLQNLGYENADQMLYLADAQDKLLKRETQALATADRIQQKHSAALSKAAKEAAAQQKALIAQLRKEESPADLKRWGESGYITQHYYVDRLRLYGYDDASILLHVDDICAKNPDFCTQGPFITQGQPVSVNGSQ